MDNYNKVRNSIIMLENELETKRFDVSTRIVIEHSIKLQKDVLEHLK